MPAEEQKERAALPRDVGLLTRLACAELKRAGVEREPLLQKAGLTARQVDDRDAWLSVQRESAFLELAAAALNDPFLGFHLARKLDLREVGLLHYLMASADIFGDALRRAARYSTTRIEGTLVKYRSNGDVTISYEHLGVPRHLDRHQIESRVTGLVREARHLTGRNVSPLSVKFIHHRGENLSELNAFFGTDVEFGADVDELAFAAAVEDMPVVSADPYLHRLLLRYCEEALAQRRSSVHTLRAEVENAIATLLPHGQVRADGIARRLGTSERTLARRLASEGLTFTTILNELKLDLARRHVQDSSLSISQIAWLLGYQEVSAFNHAFKRWTGTTPRKMRAQQNIISH